MTPLETFAKYGLDTSVKAIRERMEGNLGLYLGIVDHYCPMYSHSIRENKADELYAADLALLCSLAEKGERYEKRRAEDVGPASDYGYEGNYFTCGLCPACGRRHIISDYCPDCGQAIEWNTEAEGETK